MLLFKGNILCCSLWTPQESFSHIKSSAPSQTFWSSFVCFLSLVFLANLKMPKPTWWSTIALVPITTITLGLCNQHMISEKKVIITELSMVWLSVDVQTLFLLWYDSIYVYIVLIIFTVYKQPLVSLTLQLWKVTQPAILTTRYVCTY